MVAWASIVFRAPHGAAGGVTGEAHRLDQVFGESVAGPELGQFFGRVSQSRSVWLVPCLAHMIIGVQGLPRLLIMWELVSLRNVNLYG